MQSRDIPAEAKILVVDDEPANVRLLERILERVGYRNVIGTTDPHGVRALVEEVDPDLILLDLRMPGLDGFGVLEELQPLLASEYRPVLVLTADDTRPAKQRALTSGAKDFLTKPVDATEVLLRAHNLLQTRFLYLEERVLLEQTLQGTLEALTEVLALVNPAAFSRSLRARQLVGDLASHLGIESRWEVEIAAMLSQLGTITLPDGTVNKLHYGEALTPAETSAAARLPEIAGKIIARIPRMEGVTEILRYQGLRFDGLGTPPGAPVGVAIPWGARLLRMALDVDVLESRGMAPHLVVDTLRGREGVYDPELVEALAVMREVGLREQKVIEIDVHALRPGMILAEDVSTVTGLLLLARGQEISEHLLEWLHNAKRLLRPHQRVHVVVRERPGLPSPSPYT